MGLLEAITGPAVYLDTNIWIYAVEKPAEYYDHLVPLFKALQREDLRAVTSELTLAETLVKPLMDGNVAVQDAYLQAIRPSSGLDVMPVSREVLVEAARLRASTRMKLPDAIHSATARLRRCSCLLTNDDKVVVPGVPVVVLSKVIRT
ncbi:MAG: PIN domain-containing protein [Planctomycetota bacterium]